MEGRRRLLALEQEEERQQLAEKLQRLSPQECQEEGISLLHMKVADTWVSLFGRATISLTRSDKAVLPSHSFKTGDEVTLYSPKLEHTELAASSRCFAVISKVTQTTIEIVTDSAAESDLEPPLRLDMSASEATNKKLKSILSELQDSRDVPGRHMISIVFDNSPLFPPVSVSVEPFNTGLNPSQINAVEVALGSPHIALIHGPPVGLCCCIHIFLTNRCLLL